MIPTRLKLLILGGYGTFGGRIAELLADEPRLTLIIAGRSLEKAEAFLHSLPSKAELQAAIFDRDREVEPQLKAIGPDLVIDASGPFQAYGADPYRVVKAALALGVDYLDLADGAEFVKAVSQFDAEARSKNIFVLSGVSSFPVLTAAVTRKLSEGMSKVDSISAGIAPSPYAGVGLNVIRAIASYAGKPVRLLRDGKAATGYGLIETCRYTIAPPGRMPLKNTRFSLVDVPDLQMLPDLWPGLSSIWMGAGPVPEILHRALNGCAWLVRLRLLPSLSFMAPLMHRVTNILRWGEHRGGMFVSVEGSDANDVKLERSWHLLAEGDDGPLIPSMAVEAIIRRKFDGIRPESGARAAVRELELADYEKLFKRRAIHVGRRERTPDTASLPIHQRLLGDAWPLLPASLRKMHDVRSEFVAEGVATVERGRGVLARIVAFFLGFPPAGQEVPAEVRFQLRDGKEIWRRTFADRSFQSTQEVGKGRFANLLCERFGPIAVGLALVLDGDRLRVVVRRWSFFGVPLPTLFAPSGNTYEFEEKGRFNFHVEIAHPWMGLIVGYRGWLEPRAK